MLGVFISIFSNAFLFLYLLYEQSAQKKTENNASVISYMFNKETASDVLWMYFSLSELITRSVAIVLGTSVASLLFL